MVVFNSMCYCLFLELNTKSISIDMSAYLFVYSIRESLQNGQLNVKHDILWIQVQLIQYGMPLLYILYDTD